MRNAIQIFGLMLFFLLGYTAAVSQNHNRQISAKTATSIATHQQDFFTNFQDSPTNLEILVPDFDEENTSNENLSSSFKNKIAFPTHSIVSQRYSVINNTSSQEVNVGLAHYLIPHIGFSTPIYITNRVIRI